MKYQEALRASLTPLGRVFKIGGMFLYGFATNNARAESPKAPRASEATPWGTRINSIDAL